MSAVLIEKIERTGALELSTGVAKATSSSLAPSPEKPKKLQVETNEKTFEEDNSIADDGIVEDKPEESDVDSVSALSAAAVSDTDLGKPQTAVKAGRKRKRSEISEFNEALSSFAASKSKIDEAAAEEKAELRKFQFAQFQADMEYKKELLQLEKQKLDHDREMRQQAFQLQTQQFQLMMAKFQAKHGLVPPDV